MKKQKINKKKEEVQLAAPKSLVKTYLYILAALAFLLFANTISNGYNLDDELVTKNHPLTSRGTEAIGEIFTSPYYSDEIGYAYGYRPIVHVSFAIEHQFFGESPKVSHFFNVLLFVLAVVSFFKLLVRWTGEKQLLLAFLAALFFVVHPIHTEVVASIKNRDEILAFLFVIYSALSMEKYLSKGKITSLIWIFVLFLLAMLSKKSAFPMAIFFPLVAIFLHKVSWKKLLALSLVFLLPAIPIAAEFGWERMGLISVVSVGVLGLTFFINTVDFKKIEWRKILVDERLWGFVSLLFLVYGIKEYNLIILFIALGILIVGLRKNEKLLLYLFVLEMILANYSFSDKIMLSLVAFPLLYFLLKDWKHEKKIDYIALLLFLLVCILFALDSPNSTALILLILGVLTNVLIVYKKAILLILFIISFFISFLFIPFNWNIFSTITIAVFHFYKPLKNNVAGILACFLFIFITYNVIENSELLTIKISFTEQNHQVENEIPFAVDKTIVPTMNFKDKDELFLKEGRMLEVVENDLVLPHSQSEKIATGFSTLGEYLRLHVFPYELSFYYGFAKVKTMQLSNPWVWLSILAHLILLFLALFNLKKRPLISLGIVWYFASILLFSNWVELVAGMVGERLGFLASAGFCLFLAGIVYWIKPSFSIRKPKVLELSVLIVILLFSLKTGLRNGQWKSQLDLMASDIPHLKNSAQANNLYANNLIVSTFAPNLILTNEEKLRRQKLAIEHYSQAISIYPDFYNAAFDRGRVATLIQDTSLAIRSFRLAIDMHQSNLPDPFYNLCDIYLAKKDTINYLNYSRPLVIYDSLNVQAYNNLARGYFLNAKKDSAIITLKKAINKFPEDLDLKMNLQIVEGN